MWWTYTEFVWKDNLCEWCYIQYFLLNFINETFFYNPLKTCKERLYLVFVSDVKGCIFFICLMWKDAFFYFICLMWKDVFFFYLSDVKGCIIFLFVWCVKMWKDVSFFICLWCERVHLFYFPLVWKLVIIQNVFNIINVSVGIFGISNYNYLQSD